MSCPLCDDTGWKPVEADGVRRVVRCDCWREGLDGALLDDARIPPRYRRCDLDTFVTYPNEKLLERGEARRGASPSFPARRARALPDWPARASARRIWPSPSCST